MKLNIVNQLIALCFCSCAWADDVMLYNTGAMATSCVCFNTMNRGYVYNWTNCDWKPKEFKGGEMLFGRPLVANNVQAVDFTAMYPSIITSVGISPESIDIEESMFGSYCRFTDIIVHVCSLTLKEETNIGVCVIGSDSVDESTKDPCMECILCEWYDKNPIQTKQ
jgi:DNA polymerase elongation subunit (family B)